MPQSETRVDTPSLASRTTNVSGWMALAVQPALFATSAGLAFLLRFDFAIPRHYWVHLGVAICIWVVAKSAVFALFGLHRGFRCLSLPVLPRLALTNLAGSAAGVVGIALLPPTGFPRSIYLLDLFVCFLLTGALRVCARMYFDFHKEKKRTTFDQRKRTLIYGAGDAGELLLREIQQNPALRYQVIGFVDDDTKKIGLSVRGIRLLGCGTELIALVKRHGVDVVLIAIPSASGTQMTQILLHCYKAGVAYKTVPALGESIEQNGLAKHIREVALEDLLGRTPARLEQSVITERLGGRVVLVTGAAGSIGSELCRQIARFQPSSIVGFEINETALFHLDREMHERFPEVPFCPELGSIQDAGRLNEVFQQRQPSIVYHAAAYKHVPLMETHAFEAIQNNVFGTNNVVAASAEWGAEDFVMISTDKAVRPTNVMGATKRLAELVILSMKTTPTKCVAVRFGNVLGSNGSVIPLFKKQIEEGGPVTVTHPSMQRYFMTIPEAAQLVLQASTLGRGGEIFVLDMGEPVKIVDLARNLILLSGLRPEEDIKIAFTGLRPGEKMYEEINAFDENMTPTNHEKIRIFEGNSFSEGYVAGHLEILRSFCKMRDLAGAILQLKEIVPDYNPSAVLLRELLEIGKNRSKKHLSVFPPGALEHSAGVPLSSPLAVAVHR
jgi:FlaA1/EpsC-like NDP-sugar epimerase